MPGRGWRYDDGRDAWVNDFTGEVGPNAPYSARPNSGNTMLLDQLTSLLATLNAIKWNAWTTHWKAKGPNYYSDHLLFQRIYSGDGGGPAIDTQIDGLGERIVGLFGPGAINPAATSQQMYAVLNQVLGKSDDQMQAALALETLASNQVAKLTKTISGMGPAYSVNLDNLLRTIADERSTVVYLLQQRLGGTGTYGDALGAVTDYLSTDWWKLPAVAGILFLAWRAFVPQEPIDLSSYQRR